MVAAAPSLPPITAPPHPDLHPMFRPKDLSETRASRQRLLLGGLSLILACSGVDGSAPDDVTREAAPANGHLFTLLPSSYTGVPFENRLVDTPKLNVFTYRNYYNGGGVAIGDLTGDGLPELLLTSNQGENRLYLNLGSFRFRDVTKAAGVAGTGLWATGVTFADVNSDGQLDIYVTYAGDVDPKRRANELFIHQGMNGEGVPTFTERASQFGLADEGYSTHSAFFDYDRDGDLDLYLVNNSFRPVSSFGLRNIRHIRDALGGDRLYRNDDGRFTDVSEAAGIHGGVTGFGLGVAVGDVDRDGWPDLYVANDFFERDFLYINQKNGTFDEQLERQMSSISQFSMGLDIADIDNDGWLDLYVNDMLPDDEYRLKVTAAFESWKVYQAKLENGYHHQFMRNTLQLNNRNGTFSEIGQLAGVARTDWSWSALLADFDLDGHKDLFVTNGMPRDLTSQDYISFLADRETLGSVSRGGRVDFLRLVEAMSSTPLPNYAFRNRGDLTFSDESAAWGLDGAGFSNGAAYGDLDGDGAPDLVVNNINQEAFVYRNNTRALLANHYLQVRLEGEGANRFAVGARVTLTSEDQHYVQELMPSRGFQSSVDYVLSFGIGERDVVDSVLVEWPDGRASVLRNVPADQCLTIRQAGSAPPPVARPAPATPLLTDVTARVALEFVHRENDFVDFDRERLLPKLLSTEGPLMAVGDVNGDGLSDTFIGGAKDSPGQLFLQRRAGGFTLSEQPAFERDRVSEDLGALFFDATGDGHLDLYVVSGGNEFSDLAPALEDRLYLNDGAGRFRRSVGHLPTMNASGSRVAAADFDGDGDLDLFVGGRVVPWRYGMDPPSVLLRNDGRGRFTNATAEAAPALAKIGMVTDALWHDVDEDGRTDLVVVGEWMPITIFRNTGRTLERLEAPGLDGSFGWWNRIVAGDFTGDGRVDFVAGNLGLNSPLRASDGEPVTMHVGDFDRNGFVEQIISAYNDGVSYPIAPRDDLLWTLPFLRPRYPKYEDYARQTVSDIFTPDALAGAALKRANTFASALARNNGNGSFTLVPLPVEAQYAPIHAILPEDVDEDGRLDLLLAGNFDGFKPEFGRMSAGYGLLLRANDTGFFDPVRTPESGFQVPGQARDIQRIPTPRGDLYVVTRNDDHPLVFSPRQNR